MLKGIAEWLNRISGTTQLAGVAWAMGNVKADVPPNIEKVTPGAWETPERA